MPIAGRAKPMPEDSEHLSPYYTKEMGKTQGSKLAN